MNQEIAERIAWWQKVSVWVGGALLGVLVIGGLFSSTRAFRAYWWAWVHWTGFAAGGLLLLFLLFLARGAWGFAVQRVAEAAALTLPVVGVMLIPVFFALPKVFIWAVPGELGPGTPHKVAYLTAGGMGVRSALYFLVLSGLAWVIRRYSWMGDERPGEEVKNRLRAWSAGGVLIWTVCTLFSSTDWIMSLEPEWGSTMFLVIVAVSQFLSALAFSIAVVMLLAKSEPFSKLLTPKHFHDFGNMLLAFVIFWIYVNFSQFLIIWAGNLPKEITWYIHRSAPSWRVIAIVLVMMLFFLPFVLLLSKRGKRSGRVLVPVAGIILLANALHVYWLIVPSFRPGGPSLGWLDASAFFGVGGIWTGAFLFFFKRRPVASVFARMEDPGHG